MDEPVKHIAKWPWLAAVGFLTFVVLIGFYASDRARSERLASVGAAGVPTSVAGDAALATTFPTEPSLTTVPAPGPTSTTSAAPDPVETEPAASDCTARTLVSTIEVSGRVDESAAQSMSVEQFKCVSGYAYARLTSDVGPANAYFEWDGANYQLLALGTAVDLNQYGVPADVAQQLQ